MPGRLVFSLILGEDETSLATAASPQTSLRDARTVEQMLDQVIAWTIPKNWEKLGMLFRSEMLKGCGGKKPALGVVRETAECLRDFLTYLEEIQIEGSLWDTRLAKRVSQYLAAPPDIRRAVAERKLAQIAITPGLKVAEEQYLEYCNSFLRPFEDEIAYRYKLNETTDLAISFFLLVSVATREWLVTIDQGGKRLMELAQSKLGDSIEDKVGNT